MGIAKLKAELTNDPLGRGYAGMTDAECAEDLNTAYRQLNKTSMTGSEVVNQVVPAEWSDLTDAQKADFWDIVHLGNINPHGVEATMLITIFGAGSDTITALAAARKYYATRASEAAVGFGVVYPSHVTATRSYHG